MSTDNAEMNLKVCMTCLIWIANGDGDPDWSEEQEAAFVAAIEDRWEGWVLAAGDNDYGFSWSSCDCCGDHLGGDRHQAIAFRP